MKHLHAPVYPTLRVKNGYLRQGLCWPSFFVHFLWHSRLHVADNSVLDDGCHVQMIRRGLHIFPDFVSNIYGGPFPVNVLVLNFVLFTDKSIQSAGAAGVWRADAMKVP